MKNGYKKKQDKVSKIKRFELKSLLYDLQYNAPNATAFISKPPNSSSEQHIARHTAFPKASHTWAKLHFTGVLWLLILLRLFAWRKMSWRVAHTLGKIQAQISNCISGERITDLTLVKPKKCVATIGQSESINNNYTFKQHFKVPLFFPITIKLFLIALCPRCVWMLTQRLSKSADWHHIDKDKGADQDT